MFRPCPPAGECTCAASPARKTRPARKRSARAARGRKSEAQRTSVTSSGARCERSAITLRMPSGPRSTAAPSGNCATTWKSSVPASGQTARKCGLPSAGGKTCQWSRSRPLIRTSATSIGLGSTVSPVMPMPRARRTADRPPSAATSQRARSAEPEARCAVTPRASCSIPVTSWPKATSPPSSASRSRRISWVRHCGTIHGSSYGESSLASAGSNIRCSPTRRPSCQIMPTG